MGWINQIALILVFGELEYSLAIIWTKLLSLDLSLLFNRVKIHII